MIAEIPAGVLEELVAATKEFVVARRAQAMGGADPASQLVLWDALMRARDRFDAACHLAFGVDPWYGMPTTPPEATS